MDMASHEMTIFDLALSILGDTQRERRSYADIQAFGLSRYRSLVREYGSGSSPQRLFHFTPTSRQLHQSSGNLRRKSFPQGSVRRRIPLSGAITPSDRRLHRGPSPDG